MWWSCDHGLCGVVVPLVELWCVKKRIVVMFYVWSVIGGWSILPLGFFRCVYCVGLKWFDKRVEGSMVPR